MNEDPTAVLQDSVEHASNGRPPMVRSAAALTATDGLGGSVPEITSRNGHEHSSPLFAFRKAVKRDAKLRLALAGPSGSGKTYTLLKLATELRGRVAVVDTEHGSASKYADLFTFDVLELDNFDPTLVPELIADVEGAGYSTLIIDSLSHFWNGVNGELDQVDKIAARSKSANTWAAWREVSPKHNRMVDAMIGATVHVLVSMRVKTEWLVEKDERTGKMVPRKVGLQPVMRDGIEYEFDVCGDMDQENTLVVTKSRCPKLSGAVVQKPGRELAITLQEWLGSAVPALPGAPGKPPQKAFDLKAMTEEFARLREKVGETVYLETLGRHGLANVTGLRSRNLAVQIYRALTTAAEAEVA
jgi:hypothetical protein